MITQVWNPFCDYKLDSQIFSSFSWGDILTHNPDIDIFENNKYQLIPEDETTPVSASISNIPTYLDCSIFPVIQEDIDEDLDTDVDIDEDTDEDTDEEDEKEDEKKKITLRYIFLKQKRKKLN